MASLEGVNQKYRNRISRRDWFANVQAPYLEQSTEFINAKIKSHYARYFDLTSTSIHFIENAATLLQCDEIRSDQIDKVVEQIESVIRNADTEILAQSRKAMQFAEDHGVKVSAKFFQEPLQVVVRLLSPICFSYLDTLQKADELIVILENLRLRGVIKRGECDRQIAQIGHLLKAIQRTAFGLAVGLRRRARPETRSTRPMARPHAPQTDQDVLPRTVSADDNSTSPRSTPATAITLDSEDLEPEASTFIAETTGIA